MTKPRTVEWLEEQIGESFDDVERPEYEPSERTVTFHVPDELYDRLMARAHADGCSLAAVIRRLCEAGLDDAGAADPASIDRAIAALEALRRTGA